MVQRISEAWLVSPANMDGLRKALRTISAMRGGRVINVIAQPQRTVTSQKGEDWMVEECGPDYLLIYEYEEPDA